MTQMTWFPSSVFYDHQQINPCAIYLKHTMVHQGHLPIFGLDYGNLPACGSAESQAVRSKRNRDNGSKSSAVLVGELFHRGQHRPVFTERVDNNCAVEHGNSDRPFV